MQIQLIVILILGIALPTTSFAAQTDAAARPNILWITAEDMSPTLGCYGDKFATTPNLDDFANQSTCYSHAFASAPVCSPSRACLINGCAATIQGTHQMRSQMPLPNNMRGLPALLRESGYFTSNNVKTDYNTGSEAEIIESCWDENSSEAHWRKRKDGQPFFSIFNLMTSHQSRTMVWPYEQFEKEVLSKLDKSEIHSPDDVPLPPYYPNTPTVHKTVARYYDCVTVMDKQVGEILDQLREDGLSENTIVFFYSDHGSGMPRHKRALFDSGMRVPLMIRFPRMFRKWAPTEAGDWTNRLVTFADFLPTVLSLAGVEKLPSYVEGKPFLGPLNSEARKYVYGHRDRVDEILDTARSVRSRDFLYIRNFMPHLGYNQQNAWCDQGEIRDDFYALAKSGDVSAAQAQYLNSHRTIEELYDCTNDPLNLNNLANSPEHLGKLVKMRGQLTKRVFATRDLGFVPEVELRKIADKTPPMDWAKSDKYYIAKCYKAASLVGRARPEEIIDVLESPIVSVRYWGAVACSAAKSLDQSIKRALTARLKDSSAAVQIEAAGALIAHGDPEVGYTILKKIISGDNETEILYAARTIELLADPDQADVMRSLFKRFENAPGDMAWFIRFSTTGYLNRLP